MSKVAGRSSERPIDNGLQYQWLRGGSGHNGQGIGGQGIVGQGIVGQGIGGQGTDGRGHNNQTSGERLHLQHGPIDLVIEASGDPEQKARAYQQAFDATRDVLTGLVKCLTELRQPLTSQGVQLLLEACESPVARRMIMAAEVFNTRNTMTDNVMRATQPEVAGAMYKRSSLPFITPMICVAGSVAEYVLHAMLAGTTLQRVYINNGGDIALWLSAQSAFTVGICNNVQTGEIASRIELRAHHDVHGIATSGWRGRSHSLGIADAVTVLADSAATADAAATLIANAVDLPGCEQIHRLPAAELSPDSDLGDQLVTVGVDSLSEKQIESALKRGRHLAECFIDSGHIRAAYLSLAGTVSVCADPGLYKPAFAISG